MVETGDNNSEPKGVTVDLELPNGKIIDNTFIPEEYTTEQIIGNILEYLKLPSVNEADSQPIQYDLLCVDNNFTLREGESIRDAPVKDGHTLKLVTTRHVPLTPTDGTHTLPLSPKPDEKDVNVYVSPSNSSSSDYKRLPLDMKVGDLIRQIIEEYKVPETDRAGKARKYVLFSKGVGAVLLADKTLREVGVMHEDRLKLKDDARAGGLS